MADKSWMLNAQAIAAAKKCISVVELELGIKLKLSHPDFLQLLVDYAELNDSADLQSALVELSEYAPANIQFDLTHSLHLQSNIIALDTKGGAAKSIQAQTNSPPILTEDVDASVQVDFNGKLFPKFKDGLEFKGLYRGQPRYA